MQIDLKKRLALLGKVLEGELFYDDLMRGIYATDASVYQELPIAIAYPKNIQDIHHIVEFAQEHYLSIIPRAGGTSLAGQVVGSGIVVDISKYLNRIIELNHDEGWVTVQPGVIRDELNDYLKPFGYFFSPTTSTANRAMIGGMVGNNSCGQTSIIYGSTRNHVLELQCILSDGSLVNFCALDENSLSHKMVLQSLEGDIYRFLVDQLSIPSVQENIRNEFPKKSIQRRNTGYAIDYLLNSRKFTEGGPLFDLCNLLCGSEGTLAFTTSIKLHIDRLPPPEDVIVAIHFHSISEAMIGTQSAMRHSPTACELMDKIILDCTKENLEQRKNRFFVEGDPAAVLLVEFRGSTKLEARAQANDLVINFKKESIGYAHPVIDNNTDKVWELRKAGLGLLSNIPGDKKAVACIEDTAVDLEDLPAYIDDFTQMMASYGQQSVYYAHAGDGEIHLRPLLDLKKSDDRKLFYDISKSSAILVKKYQGSLSGEHGDGRVRGHFIPIMVGDSNYELFKKLKSTWDPNNIFNPGKIVEVPKMNDSLRYAENQRTPIHDTLFDFTGQGGILRAAEKCTGSGDCRKLPLSGGTMCPSYQVTRNEKDSTRARANTLRNYLTKNESSNPFDHEELKEVLDLCISCKGCTSECPSNVDMAVMKAEFLYQYYKSNQRPFRDKVIGNINKYNTLGSKATWVSNLFLGKGLFSPITKKVLRIAKQRSLPKISKTSLFRWYKNHYAAIEPQNKKQEVYLYCDEFINFNEPEIGIKSIKLLTKLGYGVKVINHPESGRAAISKGLLKRAKSLANKSVNTFSKLVSKTSPLLGIEPSAILSFVDEYPKMVDSDLVDDAKHIAANTMLIDEFIFREIEVGNIKSSSFHSHEKKVLFHGHCHQKSLANVNHSVWMLSIPKNYSVEIIPSGCCGMAGSFGYEEEHYKVSMQIGEMVLFPAIRNNESKIIAATGTSCRHQIFDGTQRKAFHPIEILYDALLG